MPLFKHSDEILSGLSDMLPKDFHTLGNEILSFLQKKNDIENAIVLIHFQNILARKIIKVSCDVIFKQNGIPFQQKNFIETVVSAYELPEYIFEGIRNEQIESIKLTGEDLELLFTEKGLSIDKNKRWNDLIKDCSPYTKRIILSDRVFYTIVECYNEKGDKINVMKYGVINALPEDIGKGLYPCKSKEVFL